METSRRLAEFGANLQYGDIPKAAIETAKHQLASQICATVAGSIGKSSKQFASLVKLQRLPEDAGAIGHGFKTSLWESVLLNGYTCHQSELEDVLSSQGGESWDCTIPPLVLPVAQSLRLSGRELLTAYIAGMEVHSRTNAAYTADEQGICMPLVSAIGPAACAAKALSLDARQTETALGFGLGCVPITTANLGHDAHFFESATHGLQGLIGAQLAKEGLTSNPDLRLYKAMMLKDASLEDITRDLGSRWLFCDQWIKKYPYFFGMHTFLDALQDLIKEHKLTYDQVKSIEAHISPFDKKCADRPDPRTDGDVRFSYQHALGAMMLDGKINIWNSCAEAAAEPRYIEARAKVKTILHPDFSEHLCFADPSQVDVTLKDGKKLTKTRSVLKGAPAQRLSDAEFKDLYRNFCGGILPDGVIQTTMDMIWNLENLSNVEELMRLLTFGRQ